MTAEKRVGNRRKARPHHRIHALPDLRQHLEPVKPLPSSSSVALSRLWHALLAVNIIVIVVLITSSWIGLSASRAADEKFARQSVENLTNSLANELAAELKQIANGLAVIGFRYGRIDPDTPEGQASIRRLISDQRTLLSQVDVIRVADASGNVILGLGPGTPSANIGDRDYFAAAKASDAMVVSEPLQGRIVKKWGIILAQRLLRADGSFAGVVYANLASDRLSQRFKALALGNDGAITLRSGSLRLVARYAGANDDPTKGLGSSNVSRELAEQLAANSVSGSFISRTALDGIERISAYKHVPGYPLIVLAGLGVSDFFSSWREQVFQQVVLVALVTVSLPAFSFLLYRKQRRAYADSQEIARLATEQRAMLDNDMVGMVRLKDRRAIWKNRALDAIFGYEPGELQGAPSRLLYLDEESYETVGRAGYEALSAGKRYRTQLRMRHKDGHAIWIDLSGAAVSRDTSLWMLSDITALKLNEERAHHLALHDTLTGLPNRLQFIDHLAVTLSDSARTGGTVALCFLDLDGFKAINDRWGHDAGDAVLRAIAKRLASAVRTDDMVARLGGDEFTIALRNAHDLSELHAILERLAHEIEQPIELSGDRAVCVGASIGVAISPIHGTTAADLMKVADEEMYVRKRARRLKTGPAGAEPTSADAIKSL